MIILFSYFNLPLTKGVKQVENVIIYYQQEQSESANNAIDLLNSLIDKLKNYYIIKGVFIDPFNSQTEFMEMIQSPLSEIDYLLIDKLPYDEFNKQLILGLSNSENFKIKLFSEIQI